MHYRYISFIEANKAYALKKSFRDKTPNTGDFMKYLQENSALEIISKERLDEQKVQSSGVQRSDVEP